jgi:hypothetical protein
MVPVGHCSIPPNEPIRAFGTGPIESSKPRFGSLDDANAINIEHCQDCPLTRHVAGHNGIDEIDPCETSASRSLSHAKFTLALVVGQFEFGLFAALGGPNGSMLYDVRPHACASIFHSWPCFENVYARVPVRTTVWPLIVTVRVPARTAYA